MHEINVWLNLSSSPETNMSHMAWAFDPILMPSEPRHSQPWTLMAFQSDSAGSDGYSTAELSLDNQLCRPVVLM